MAKHDTTPAQDEARANLSTAQAYKGPQKPRNPDGTLAPPPRHEETLGALPDAPPEVKERYAETGKTPPSSWRRNAVEAPEAPQLRGVPEGATDTEEETFAGRPLSSFDGIADDQLTNEQGVGPATAKEIQKARRARDRKANR